MLTHSEVCERLPYSAVLELVDLCDKDLNASDVEFSVAYNYFKKAKAEYDLAKTKSNLSKKLWAEVAKLRAQLSYAEKFALYCDFMGN